MKIAKLLFFLFMTSLLKADSPSVISAKNEDTTQKMQEEGLTPRLKKLLHKHRRKFNNIEHYYTWEPVPYTNYTLIMNAIFVGLPALVGFGMIFDVILVVFIARKYIFSEVFSVAIIGAFMLGVSGYFLNMGKEACRASMQPGCFCLTDKGVIIIPHGKGGEMVWLPYSEILFLKKYTLSCFEDYATLYEARQNIVEALECINEQGVNHAKGIAKLLHGVSTTDTPSTSGGEKKLWIIYKKSSKLFMNTYCDTNAFESLEAFDHFCKHLQEKIKNKPTNVDIKKDVG